MVKKTIAAAMLIAMVAWAEMALAPMLAMQGHAHSPSAIDEHAAMHHHAMNHALSAGHACCPKIGVTSKAEDLDPVEVASGTLPCQDSHRCCFEQGPQNVPAPVNGGQKFSQEIAPAEDVEYAVAVGGAFRSFPGIELAPGPPPIAFGMVLRV
jgi:hypothetical protein